jgi:hypothetical protein
MLATPVLTLTRRKLLGGSPPFISHHYNIPENRSLLMTEELYLPGYNKVQSTENELIFWTSMIPPFSGPKNKPSKKPA